MIGGRKPTPIARAIAEGDTRKIGVRKLREKLAREPKAESGYPDCPEHLTGMARETWYELAEQIAIMGLDKRPDALLLEGTCVAYARAVQADQQVMMDGITLKETTIDEESGEVVLLRVRANPAVAVSATAWRELRAFAEQFGLSPVSRTRLAIEKPDDGAQELAAALSAPREPRADSMKNPAKWLGVN